MHNDQGCLSDEFFNDLFKLSDGKVLGPLPRKTSLPLHSIHGFTNNNKERYSRNELSVKPANGAHITEWNVSNVDLSDEFN